ncbi:unnamed protein product [Oikopleura dioica]|uniref:Ubiquitin-like protease family profile domain-containing protein n=1 Tax=Oikopleura dioica TaxID=34765 RepID=E4XZM1_OIKDI|nr:unnamed protein product [Oikopleura dioica]
MINDQPIQKYHLKPTADLIDYGCMNDYVLDAFCHLLQKYNLAFNTRTTIKDTIWSQQLVSGCLSTFSEIIYSAERICFPVFVPNINSNIGHWIFCIIDTLDRSLRIFCSLNRKHEAVAIVIKSLHPIIRDDYENVWTTIYPQVPKQHCNDCGYNVAIGMFMAGCKEIIDYSDLNITTEQARATVCSSLMEGRIVIEEEEMMREDTYSVNEYINL